MPCYWLHCQHGFSLQDCAKHHDAKVALAETIYMHEYYASSNHCCHAQLDSLTCCMTHSAFPHRLERPIVLYNERRRYYTLLLHVDTVANDVASVAVATSPSPYGPFVLQRVFKPDGLGSYDLTAVQEPGGDAYLVSRTTSQLYWLVGNDAVASCTL